MFKILGWAIYGLIVGSIAKALHPGEDPIGCLPTIGIGVVGAFVGGGINWLLNFGGPFAPSGMAMGVVGGVLACWAYKKWHLDQYVKAQSVKEQNPYH